MMNRISFKSSAVAAALILSAAAATAQTQPAEPAARVRSGVTSSPLSVAEGGQLSLFARQLGHISAMARSEDGRLFVTDERSGRLIILMDRALDGRVDLQRSLPHRFDKPTGLALKDGQIFVADRKGVWTIGPSGGVILLASLTQSGSKDSRYDLGITQEGRLRLGFSRQDGTASLIGINIKTGEASQIERTRGEFTGFTRGADVPLWMMTQIDGTVRLGANFKQGLILPENTRHIWLDGPSSELLIATQTHILRARLGLGKLDVSRDALVSGFAPEARQLRRGRPGPLVQDERGLLFTDQERGEIWRLVLTDGAAIDDAAGPNPSEEFETKTGQPVPIE